MPSLWQDERVFANPSMLLSPHQGSHCVDITFCYPYDSDPRFPMMVVL